MSPEQKKKISDAMTKLWKNKRFRKNLVEKQVKLGYRQQPITKSIFIVTDDCMWEKNKQEGTKSPHAICVVDEKTGQQRYILGGSRIKFIDGTISKERTQEDYNKQK